MFRPRYPASLYETLSKLTKGHNIAWDCATGNGQAAIGLAKHFKLVIANDASAPQLLQAIQVDNVRYIIALAEHSALASSSIDLITVAESLHWFDITAFLSEAHRVLVPGGILAIWNYGNTHINEEIDSIVSRFKDNFLAPYWPAEAKRADVSNYAFPDPFVELPLPVTFEIEMFWSLPELLGYMRSWSAVERCIGVTKTSPLNRVHGQLGNVWGSPNAKQRVRWPMTVRVARCQR